MPNFAYTAVGANNRVVNGHLEGADRDSVYKHLQEQGIRPLSIKESEPPIKGFSLTKALGAGKVKSDHIVIFTRELSAMVSAGVPLLRSLNSLAQHTESPALKKILASVIKDVEAGTPLADALEKFPDTFTTVYVNMVRAGEAAGILDEILKRLATQQEKSATMRKKIKSAMTYPMVLVVITIVAFFGLMLFVIPQIGKIIQDLGGPGAQLPLITQVMLGISGFMTSYWYILIPIFVGAAIGLLRYINTKNGRRQFHTLLINTPGIKNIARKVAVARFARTFSALIGAGVAVLEALEVTSHAIGNVVYEKILLDAAEEVKNGATLSSIIEKSPLFPAIVPQMLSVGEETGQTDVVLVKVADFYEEEVDVAIDGLSSIIEPVMIVFMGGMVGLIAASVMSPIANLSQSIR